MKIRRETNYKIKQSKSGKQKPNWMRISAHTWAHKSAFMARTYQGYLARGGLLWSGLVLRSGLNNSPRVTLSFSGDNFTFCVTPVWLCGNITRSAACPAKLAVMTSRAPALRISLLCSACDCDSARQSRLKTGGQGATRLLSATLSFIMS